MGAARSRVRPLIVGVLALGAAAAASAALPANGLGAVALRSSSSAATAAPGRSLTLPLPGGVSVGDVLVAGVVARVSSRGTVTPPAGWTIVRTDTNVSPYASLTQALYVRVVGANEPSSYRFEVSASVGVAGAVLAYSGVDTAAPVIASSGLFAAQTKTITAPSVAASAGAVIAGFFGTNEGGGVAPPSGMSEVVDTAGGGSSIASLEVASGTQSVGGSSGSRAARIPSRVSSAIGQLIALKPAGTVAPPPSPPPSPPPVVPAGTYFVSPAGSDSAAGTADRPFRTIGHALRLAKAGDTVLVRAGTYTEWASFEGAGSAGAPVVLGNYPGERPSITGRLRITGSYFRVSGFAFLGQTSANRSGTMIYVTGGRHIEITGNEIAKAWTHGIYLDAGATDITITRNWIHDNGTHAVYDHGIYWETARSGVIANNLVTGNRANGMQLYPNADDVVVTHNTVVGNGRFGIVVGGESTTSDGNMIVNNVVAFNADYGIRTYWGGPVGSGNVAQANLVYGNPKGNTFGSGMTFLNTIVADPKLVARSSGDYHLGSASPAIDRALAAYAQPVDYEGRSRPQGAAADLGAFER